MDIGKFLRSGETTLYSNAVSKLAAKAAPLVISLTLGALNGCSSLAAAPTIDALALTGNAGTQAQAVPASGPQYAMDGPTLMYQAMIDPTMKSVNVASSTSQFLAGYLAAQPDSVVIKRGDPVRRFSPPIFQALLDPAKHDGISAALDNTGQGASACLVMTRGINNEYSARDLQAEAVVSAIGAINISSLSRSLAYIAIHESAHCRPFLMMQEPDQGDRLELSYFSSLRELRSDLAVVLFSASKLGTFEDGLVAVGAERGVVSTDITHSDFEMLKLVLKDLDAEQFYGKPLHELIAYADKAVAQMNPATNQSMREAFAREAWANTTISDYKATGSIRQAPAEYAHFTGKPFAVNLHARAKEVVDLSLDNALRSPGAVRLSLKINARIVQAYAETIGGGELTQDQIAKADFLDGRITPVNSMKSADGKVSLKASTLDMSVLLGSLRSTLSSMAEQGVVLTPSQYMTTGSQAAPEARLSSRLSNGLKAMENAGNREETAQGARGFKGLAPRM